MEPMWAAWAADSPERHPNCVCSLQTDTETKWPITFFTGHGATIERFFSLDAYSRVGTTVVIGTDASPWGLGGRLMVDGVIKEYFASPITPKDVTKFGFTIGCNKGQQVWEALAILVAVDLWAEYWQRQRIVLMVKSDNVTALSLLIKMRPPKWSGLAIVARELALKLVDLSFPPDAQHILGVGHVLAATLSRVYSPSGTGTLTDDLHAALPSAKVPLASFRDGN